MILDNPELSDSIEHHFRDKDVGRQQDHAQAHSPAGHGILEGWTFSPNAQTYPRPNGVGPI
jgi:hypothetical protein